MRKLFARGHTVQSNEEEDVQMGGQSFSTKVECDLLRV